MLQTNVFRFMMGTSRERVEKACSRPGLERKPENSDVCNRAMNLRRQDQAPRQRSTCTVLRMETLGRTPGEPRDPLLIQSPAHCSKLVDHNGHVHRVP